MSKNLYIEKFSKAFGSYNNIKLDGMYWVLAMNLEEALYIEQVQKFQGCMFEDLVGIYD